MGFEPPLWRALADGVRPDSREPEDYEPGVSRQGWQHEAASRVERQFRDGVLFERSSRSGTDRRKQAQEQDWF